MKRVSQLLLALGLLMAAVPAAAAEVLSWTDCVHEVQLKNPDLKAASATLRSSEYKTKGARSGFFPQVSGNLSTTDQNDIGSTHSATVSATQNVFAGFRDVASIAQGKANEEASRANVRSVKSQVSFDLKSAFASLLYAQEALKLTRDIIRRREDNLNLIQLRYENGRENKGSMLLSKAYLEQARYDELLARDALRVARKQMAKVLGREESSPIQVIGGVPLTSPPTLEDVGWIARETPDYQQAVAQKKAAKEAVTVARSPFFPSLDVSGTVGRLGRDAFTNTSSRWAAGVGLSWPLFSGGKDYYATKSAGADLVAAKYNEEIVKLQMTTELEQALTGFVEAVQKLKTDASFLTAAAVREEISRSRYENGLLSFEDWDIIENDFIARQKQVLQSRRDRVKGEAAWEQSQGKGVIP